MIPEPLLALLDALTLSGGYNTTLVMLGAAGLGANGGAIGTYVTLRRRALVGDAAAHATLPGLVIAFLVMTALTGEGRVLPALMAGAAATALLGLLAVDWLARSTRLDEDVAIAAVLSTFFGAGVVLLTVVQALDTGGQAGLSTFLLGSTAGMTQVEAAIIAVAGALTFAAIHAARRAFALVCFDPDFAATVGIDVAGTDRLMMLLLVITAVIGLEVAGLVMVVALTVIPPVAARFWTNRVRRMMWISAAIGAAAGYVGAALSAAGPALPTGPLIVLAAGAVFLISLVFGPARGLLAGGGR